MTSKTRIAIDGPGGAGKSTIAKLLAKKLDIEYVDTGAMYRAIAYKMMMLDCKPNEIEKLEKILDETDIDFSKGHIYLDGKIIDEEIRTKEAGNNASNYAKLGAVRKKLVCLQKDMAKEKSLVMDGRDIGTNVLVDAEYKFFITAKPEERARRRTVQLKEKGEDSNFDEILEEIKRRDEQDRNRKLNPLIKAEDAILIDTTDMTIENVIDFMCNKML